MSQSVTKTYKSKRSHASKDSEDTNDGTTSNISNNLAQVVPSSQARQTTSQDLAETFTFKGDGDERPNKNRKSAQNLLVVLFSTRIAIGKNLRMNLAQ